MIYNVVNNLKCFYNIILQKKKSFKNPTEKCTCFIEKPIHFFPQCYLYWKPSAWLPMEIQFSWHIFIIHELWAFLFSLFCLRRFIFTHSHRKYETRYWFRHTAWDSMQIKQASVKTHQHVFFASTERSHSRCLKM